MDKYFMVSVCFTGISAVTLWTRGGKFKAAGLVEEVHGPDRMMEHVMREINRIAMETNAKAMPLGMETHSGGRMNFHFMFEETGPVKC